MHSLDAITAACNQAIEDEADGRDWHYVYTDTVDPQSVLELVAMVGGSEGVPSTDELAALAKIIRDLSGYLRYAAGDKPDPVRDDLVQQANQLLGLAGL